MHVAKILEFVILLIPANEVGGGNREVAAKSQEDHMALRAYFVDLVSPKDEVGEGRRESVLAINKHEAARIALDRAKLTGFEDAAVKNIELRGI